ncbi:MAG: uridine kinase [Clostridia bacterium]|nr:uridine kinase [Clostridia bacterium]
MLNVATERDYQRLLTQIETLLQQRERVFVAIDGPCAAGKTELAARLARQLPANVFHTNNFTLPLDRRTSVQMAQVAGHMDIERLRREVLWPLTHGQRVYTGVYDPARNRIRDRWEYAPKPVAIVEGTYSAHPALRDLYDLTVFVTVSRTQQKKRMAAHRDRRRTRRWNRWWIPAEACYFKEFSIEEHCDVVCRFPLDSAGAQGSPV